MYTLKIFAVLESNNICITAVPFFLQFSDDGLITQASSIQVVPLLLFGLELLDVLPSNSIKTASVPFAQSSVVGIELVS